jgi:tetratricopeptide (TPR) repeat protein
MAEEAESQDAGAEAAAAGGADPAAVALALGGASREDAGAFLKDQRALIADQRHHLHEQLKQLRLGIFSQRVSIALKGLTALVGLVVVIGVAVAVWNASQAEGLVVDAFSVPPAVAASGVTADVLADDLTTRFAAIRDFANDHSLARSQDVSQDRNQEIKVEIPETGVSLTQAWRYLKSWLGHERRLNGDLRDMGDGKIVLAVALDGRDAFVLRGTAGDIDGLEDQAAERIFAEVDPTNYVLYLYAKGRLADALAAAARLPQLARTPADMADAYSLWSEMTRVVTGDVALGMARARISVALNAKATASHMELMNDNSLLGHDEDALAQAREIADKRKEDEPAWRNSDGVAYVKRLASDVRNAASGDFQQLLSESCFRRGICSGPVPDLMRAEFAARLHDGTLSRALNANAAAEGPADPVQQQRTRYFLAAAAQDWPAALVAARAYVNAASHDTQYVAPRMQDIQVATHVMPLLAYALARTGDLAAAHRAIDGTPEDCTLCLDMRGNIDAVQGNWDGAVYWFARAVQAAPSYPFAYVDWGSMLLAQGKPDEAIAKFKLAGEKGPHFADPLEGWGEALMAKNQSHLAVAKFAQAEKYAPNWGRLHLKWGEALFYAGKKDEAQKQFARAATLDLTPSEKAELARYP